MVGFDPHCLNGDDKNHKLLPVSTNRMTSKKIELIAEYF